MLEISLTILMQMLVSLVSLLSSCKGWGLLNMWKTWQTLRTGQIQWKLAGVLLRIHQHLGRSTTQHCLNRKIAPEKKNMGSWCLSELMPPWNIMKFDSCVQNILNFLEVYEKCKKNSNVKSGGLRISNFTVHSKYENCFPVQVILHIFIDPFEECLILACLEEIWS